GGRQISRRSLQCAEQTLPNGDIGVAGHLASAHRADLCNDTQRHGQHGGDLYALRQHAYSLASLGFNNGVGYFAGTAAAEGYATDATTGTLLWEAVDKRGGTNAVAENTLNTWLDVDHAFEAWSEQLASRLQELGACRS